MVTGVVHQMNIESQAPCAWGGIGGIKFFPDTLCMAGKRHFLRQWREHRGKTLVQVAEHLHMSHGNLSKIERGLVPYNQDLLEALAELYMCEPADLIVRNPTDSAQIWSLWEQAAEGDKRKIVSIARTIVEGSEESEAA